MDFLNHLSGQLLTHAGPLCAFGSSFTWAIGVTFYTRLSEKNAGSAVNISRGIVASFCYIILGLLTLGPQLYVSSFSQIPAMQLAWLILGVLGSYALGDLIFFRSATTIGVPAALAIASSYPIFSAFLGWAIKGETLGSTQWAGLVLAVMGTALVILSSKPKESAERESVTTEHIPEGAHRMGQQKSLHSKQYAWGVVLAFLAAACWSLNAVGAAQGSQGLHPFVANTIRMLLVVLLCPVVGIVTYRKNSPTNPQSSHKLRLLLSSKDFKRHLWVFFLEGFGGSLLFVYGLAHSEIAVGSALSSLAPVISVPIAVLSGREKFSPLKTWGVIQVVAGIVLLT